VPPGPREKRHLRDLDGPYTMMRWIAHTISRLLAQGLGHAHLGSVPDGRYKAYT
jgi:hypothetical protein